MSPPVFVEAFPDALEFNALESFRQVAIHTTSGPGEQVHLFTTPGGIIDRIVVDQEATRKERIGRADLPEGHELRAAADPGDGSLLVFTFKREDETSHVWRT